MWQSLPPALASALLILSHGEPLAPALYPPDLYKLVTWRHPFPLSGSVGKRAIGLWLKDLLVWNDYSLKIKSGDLVIQLVPYSCKTHCHCAFHRKSILIVVTERHEANVNNFQPPTPLLPTKPESINNGEPCVSGHKNESLNIWVTSRWGAPHSLWVSGSGIDIGWAIWGTETKSELPDLLWF